MSFTIFQNEKTVFQAVKKRRSKSRKIDIFPKGITHAFGLKMVIFQTFFRAIKARKMSFTIFQNETTPFQAIKTRSSKSRKIDIFPKGLTHGFGPKMGIFPTLFFRLNRPGKRLLPYSSKKNAFLGYKNKKFKKSKIDIFPKGITHAFGLKMVIFQTFFFRAIQPRKCLLRYSRTKKRLSRL